SVGAADRAGGAVGGWTADCACSRGRGLVAGYAQAGCRGARGTRGRGGGGRDRDAVVHAAGSVGGQRRAPGHRDGSARGCCVGRGVEDEGGGSRRTQCAYRAYGPRGGRGGDPGWAVARRGGDCAAWAW